MAVGGGSSYWDWSGCLSAVLGQKVSKQAIFRRMNIAWVSTTKALLKHVLAHQIVKRTKAGTFSHFHNVWIQDSTSIHLPEVLIEKFKGNRANGKPQSVAKLNVIVHALNGFCPMLEWTGFVVAEQSLSSNILKVAKKGDLVIRDLGYFVMDVFKQLIKEQIHFLSRLKYGPYIYDIKTGDKIDLVKKLKRKNHIDLIVKCTKEHGLETRLVAIKLPEKQANERRRKAKKNNQKGINHNKEYYELLDYCLFITSVGEEIWNYQQVAEAYRARWNVEILFKSWKTGLRMNEIVPAARIKTERVESFLYLMMIYIALFQLIIWYPLKSKMRKVGKWLSIIQVTKWGAMNAPLWLEKGLSEAMEKEILYYCRYDTRKRINVQERSTNIFISLS